MRSVVWIDAWPNKNGSAQEFDERPNWRGFQNVGFPTDVGALCNCRCQGETARQGRRERDLLAEGIPFPDCRRYRVWAEGFDSMKVEPLRCHGHIVDACRDLFGRHGEEWECQTRRDPGKHGNAASLVEPRRSLQPMPFIGTGILWSARQHWPRSDPAALHLTTTPASAFHQNPTKPGGLSDSCAEP